MAAAHSVSRPAQLRLESMKTPFETTIRATGRITSATVDKLQHTICELIPEFRRIVLDLSHVDYIDSSGMGMLAAVYNHAKGTRCELEIANPKPRLRDVLRTWMKSVFRGHDEFLGLTPD